MIIKHFKGRLTNLSDEKAKNKSKNFSIVIRIAVTILYSVSYFAFI